MPFKKRKISIDFKINEDIPINEKIPHLLPNWKTSTRSNLKVVSWNVNSLNACSKKGFYKYLEAEEPDIICLQETKLNTNQYSFPRFVTSLYPYQYIHSSIIKKGYSGCLILSKFKPLECIYGFIQHSSSHTKDNNDNNNNDDDDYCKQKDNLNSSLQVKIEKEKKKVETKEKMDKEGRVITLIFPHIHLINIYVPCARENFERLKFKLDFMDRVKTHLSLLKRNAPILCCGDLNIAHNDIDVARPHLHLRSPGFTNEERVYFTEWIGNEFLDVWREIHPGQQRFTFYPYRGKCRIKRLGWRFDYFITDRTLLESQDIVDCDIRDCCYGPSDHVPLVLHIKKWRFVHTSKKFF